MSQPSRHTVRAVAITSTSASNHGAPFSVAISATRDDPYVSVAITRERGDDAPNAAVALPPLRILRDDLASLRDAIADAVDAIHSAA